MENMTFGDGVVLATICFSLIVATYLAATVKNEGSGNRCRPTSYSVARQRRPLADQRQRPVFEMVVDELMQVSEMTGSPIDQRDYYQVCADIVARAMLGFERYGTHLAVDNGRCMLTDGYQEALDLMLYAKAAQVEAENKGHFDLASQALLAQANALSAAKALLFMLSNKPNRDDVEQLKTAA